jgi:glutaredoxin 3
MGSSTRFTVISVIIAVLIGIIAYKVEPYFSKKGVTVSNVIIYSTATCPYCVKAKQLLTSKNVQFTEYFVDKDLEKREEMLKLSGGRRTVPQIFINDKHIGGCDDLYQLESDKKLDDLLKK